MIYNNIFIYKIGANDVKTHRWFGDIDWEALLSKNIHAPYKPTIK